MRMTPRVWTDPAPSPANADPTTSATAANVNVLIIQTVSVTVIWQPISSEMVSDLKGLMSRRWFG